MKKIAVILADGMEELEALTPVDVLRRAGASVDTISIKEKTVTSSHGVGVVADKLLEQVDLDLYDVIVLPGGMPGAKNISENAVVISAVKNALKQNKLVSAICASPAVILANHHLLDGYQATCYPAPDFINAIGDKYVNQNVCTSNNLITANGPKSAFEFAFAICEYLELTPKF